MQKIILKQLFTRFPFQQNFICESSFETLPNNNPSHVISHFRLTKSTFWKIQVYVRFSKVCSLKFKIPGKYNKIVSKRFIYLPTWYVIKCKEVERKSKKREQNVKIEWRINSWITKFNFLSAPDNMYFRTTSRWLTSLKCYFESSLKSHTGSEHKIHYVLICCHM